MRLLFNLIVASIAVRTRALPYIAAKPVSHEGLIGHEIQPRATPEELKTPDGLHDPLTHGIGMDTGDSLMEGSSFSQVLNEKPSYEVVPLAESSTNQAEIGHNGVQFTGKAVIIEVGETIFIYGFGDRIWEQTFTKDSAGNGEISYPMEWKPYSALDFSQYDKHRAEAYGGISVSSRMDLAQKIGEGIRILQAQVTPEQNRDWTTLNEQARAARNLHGPLRELNGEKMQQITVVDNFQFVPAPRDPATKWGSTPNLMPPSLDDFEPIDLVDYLLDGEGFDGDMGFFLKKRHTLIDEIKSQGSSLATTGNNSSTAGHTAEFQLFLRAYQTAQTNVSNLLFPYFDSILNKTNNSLVYDIVWSVFSDLTGLGPAIIGPFSFGMHRLDWIEDQYFNSTLKNDTGLKTADPIGEQMLATHYSLLQIYNAVWTNASAIANQTGLLGDMATLSRYLAPQNSSIKSSTWTSPQTGFDDSYFTTYNRTRS